MDPEYDPEDEFLDDVELFEGEPDFDRSETDADGAQDDDVDVPLGLGFMSRATGAIRNWREALHWYDTHQTKAQIGFDPDGMCLKVCRTARNIPAKHLTAKEAQDNTPEQFRVYKVEDLRKGMVVFCDELNDSNKSGHIATVVGRLRGHKLSDKAGVVTETNSVVSDQLVRVTLDYYETHWNDQFKFGSTFLNGVEFDVAGGKTKVERFNDGGPVYNLNLLAKAHKAGREHAGRVLVNIETQVKRLPDHPKFMRVREFKEEWRDTRKIDMSLLDEAVKLRPSGLIRRVRDEIRRLINTLPDE